MEDDKLDELSTIQNLVEQLNQNVNEVEENSKRVTQTVKSLVPEDVYNRLVESPTTTSTRKLSKIQILESVRIHLIMELQKQDYITKNLKELIDQNQELLDSVKEYLQCQGTLKEEAKLHAKLMLENYIKTSIEPTLNNLKKS
ncbi:uncharacterized protein KGF55_000894 [Candida pseudojiufengensis]|uniref:uncharacterized protein n=1 Tax=Candida pseudojiufengensis TaxID=497109 RepID=UPI00222471DD|nr:uncharacterized protein KGF55_000894 [Candida pseudojiufengensis]KAI5966584.1 hypothetical protein KGF55_000894 [Candida pseudojiufengensis]